MEFFKEHLIRVGFAGILLLFLPALSFGQNKLLDQLPADNALYVWTDDSQQLFESLLKQQTVSLPQIATAWQVPEEWISDRDEFVELDVESALLALRELKELWETPLFDGEAALIRKGNSFNETILILDAPADEELYERAIQLLNQLCDPLTESARKKLEAAGLERDEPTGGAETKEAPNIHLMGNSFGYWAHDGERFYWAMKREEITNALSWYTPKDKTDAKLLTDDRAYETVFRNISTTNRAKAIANFYVPPEGQDYLFRLGLSYASTGLAALYSPAWLDMARDLRAVGGCVYLPDEQPDNETEVQIGWQWESFALITRPRGPVLSSLKELDLDHWAPPSVPRKPGMYFAFGFDGVELAKSFVEIEERFEHLPKEIAEHRGGGDIPISVDKDGEVIHAPRVFMAASPKVWEPLKEVLASADEFLLVTCASNPKFTLGSTGYQEPFLFVHSSKSSEEVSAALKFYLSFKKPLLSGVSNTQYHFRPEAEFVNSNHLDGKIESWKLDEAYRESMVEEYAQLVRGNIEAQRQAIEQLPSDTKANAAERSAHMEAFPDVIRSYEIHKRRFNRSHNSVWIRNGEWLLLHDVDPDVLEHFREPNSATANSSGQQAQLLKDVELLRFRSGAPESTHGLLSLTSIQVGLNNRVLDVKDPSRPRVSTFGIYNNKSSRANANYIERSIKASRVNQLSAMLLHSFDRLVVTFHDSDKGITFHGATLGKREFQSIEQE